MKEIKTNVKWLIWWTGIGVANLMDLFLPNLSLSNKLCNVGAIAIAVFFLVSNWCKLTTLLNDKEQQ